MKRLRAALVFVVQIGVLCAATTLLPATADAQTWTLKEVRRTEAERVEGRGNDFIEYDPSISFTPPETVTVGDSFDISVSVSYSYGAGEGGENNGRPKRLGISISVPNGGESESWDLVSNYCRWPRPKDLPAPMSKGGSVQLSSSGELTADDAERRGFSIGVTVSASVYCWEPEAGGSAGFVAYYERVEDDAEVGVSDDANQPPSVAILLRDPDRVLTPGQKTMLKARVRDDRDLPAQMTYIWKVTNNDTGASKTLQPRVGKRVVTWTVGDEATYTVEVTVRDRDGAEGTATRDIRSENPRIIDLGVTSESQKEVSVARYWQNGIPATRRGDRFEIGATLEHLNPRLHCVRLYVDGKRISKEDIHPDGWRAKLLNFDGASAQVLVQVPEDLPIGEHSLEFALNRRERPGSKTCEDEITRESLPDDLVILFNPLGSAPRPDVSVAAGKNIVVPGFDHPTSASAYTLGTYDTLHYPGEHGPEPSYYDVTPWAPNTHQVAMDIVAGLEEGARARAADVAMALTYGVGSRIYGRWGENVCYISDEPDHSHTSKAACNAAGGVWDYEDGTGPSRWMHAESLFSEHVRTNRIVRYGQCFVYGMTLVAVLRSVGIPARMITVAGSAHDSVEPWGVGNTDYDRNDRNVHGIEVWNFHVWVEAWIPEVNSTSGWVLLDATAQGRAGGPRGREQWVATPGLDEVVSVSHLPLPQQYQDGHDDVFVFAETNIPGAQLQLDCDRPCASTWPTNAELIACLRDRGRNPPYGSILECMVGKRAAFAGWVDDPSGNRLDHLPGYKVPRSVWPRYASLAPSAGGSGLGGGIASTLLSLLVPSAAFAQEEETEMAQIEFPAEVELARSVSGRVEFRDLPDDEPVGLIIRVQYMPPSLTGGSTGAGVQPETVHIERRTITPSGLTWSGEFEVPSNALGRAGSYVLVVGLNGTAGAMDQHHFQVNGLPVNLTVDPEVTVGTDFVIRAAVTNPMAESIANVSLEVLLSTGLETADSTSVGPGELASGESLEIEITARASSPGRHLVQVATDSSLGPSSTAAEVVAASTDQELAVRGISLTDISAGADVEVSAEIGNPGARDLADAEAILAAVDGIEIVSDSTVRTETISSLGRWRPVWTVRAAEAGSYQLMVIATAGDMSGSGTLRLLVGAEDADDLPLPPEEDITVPLDEGEDASDPSLVPIDVDAEGGVPGDPVAGTPGGSGGGGGGGGRGPATGGTTPFWAVALAIFLAVGSLAMIGAIGYMITRRSRRTSTSQAAAAAGERRYASIKVVYEDSGTKAGRLDVTKRATVGRSPQSDLTLNDPTVSARHAQFAWTDDGLVITDLGSTSGTFVNGSQVTRAIVRAGDEIRFGSTLVQVMAIGPDSA